MTAGWTRESGSGCLKCVKRSLFGSDASRNQRDFTVINHARTIVLLPPRMYINAGFHDAVFFFFNFYFILFTLFFGEFMTHNYRSLVFSFSESG